MSKRAKKHRKQSTSSKQASVGKQTSEQTNERVHWPSERTAFFPYSLLLILQIDAILDFEWHLYDWITDAPESGGREEEEAAEDDADCRCDASRARENAPVDYDSIEPRRRCHQGALCSDGRQGRQTAEDGQRQWVSSQGA